MENQYRIESARRATGDPNDCLIVLHNNDDDHIEVRVRLEALNEMVDALNNGAAVG